MYGTFAATSFEVEAERRREVLAASMHHGRRHAETLEGEGLETERPIGTLERRGLAGIAAAASVVGRLGVRAAHIMRTAVA